MTDRTRKGSREPNVSHVRVGVKVGKWKAWFEAKSGLVGKPPWLGRVLPLTGGNTRSRLHENLRNPAQAAAPAEDEPDQTLEELNVVQLEMDGCL